MSWVETEFESIDLGDHRLNCRSITITEELGLAPGRSIPQTFKSRADIKAAYNFFSNKLVSDEKLIKPHIERTIERVKEYPVVLLPSDTTEIDYTSKKAMKGKERLSNKKSGLWLHSTIAVTPERLNLGTIEANFWSRNSEVSQDNGVIRDQLPIEEKESYRWLQNYRTACDLAREAPGTHVINMMDREGDIVEIFSESIEQRKHGDYADFIVRSQHNRVIEEQDNENKSIQNKLRSKLNNSEILGEIEFTIPPTEKRKGRKVKQQIKAATVVVRPKRSFKDKVKVNALMAIELDPPENETPLTWNFVTSLPIDTFDDVCKVIKYYLCRWEIETFFKVLKSGCKIEERQLQGNDRMKALISVFLVLSWRVVFTMMLGRISAKMRCDELFVESEWKSVYKILNKEKRVPRHPPSLGEFIDMVAKLGGYRKQNNGPPPGVKVMWRGMSRMVDFAIAWEAFGG